MGRFRSPCRSIRRESLRSAPVKGEHVETSAAVDPAARGARLADPSHHRRNLRPCQYQAAPLRREFTSARRGRGGRHLGSVVGCRFRAGVKPRGQAASMGWARARGMGPRHVGGRLQAGRIRRPSHRRRWKRRRLPRDHRTEALDARPGSFEPRGWDAATRGEVLTLRGLRAEWRVTPWRLRARHAKRQGSRWSPGVVGNEAEGRPGRTGSGADQYFLPRSGGPVP